MVTGFFVLCFGTQVKTEDVSVPGKGKLPGSVAVDASFEENLRFVLSWTSDTSFTALQQNEGIV